MKLTTAILASLAIFAVTAEARDLAMVEGAYEAPLVNVTLPQSIAGSALFRTCSDCDPVGLRVSGQTVFQVSGAAMMLDDFLGAVGDIRNADGAAESTLVAIFYDLETNMITRINVLPPRG